MAIKGMYLTDYENAFIEQMHVEAVGYKEIVERTVTDLKALGVIPVLAENRK